MVDLHLHTVYSDGSWEPQTVAERAFQVGLRIIAITDHDGVGGIDEATEAGERLGLRVIPGIELSALHRGIETHVLGYFIDHREPGLLRELDSIAKARSERVADMVGLLRRKGLDISFEDVIAQSPKGYLGRPHIAKAMVAKGIIAGNSEAFTLEFIGNEGECYLPTCELSVAGAIEIIHSAKGIAVLAHPGFWSGSQGIIPDDDIEGFVAEGLEGIECRHFRHPEEVARHFEAIAERLGVLKTGGSDCHGDYYNPVKIGTVEVPFEWFKKLEDYCNFKGGRKWC